MTDTILEVAAYLCLAMGVALLVARVFHERIEKATGVWKFKRTLRRLDGVPSEWTRAMDAMEDMHEDEPVRRHRRHQHPSTPDER